MRLIFTWIPRIILILIVAFLIISAYAFFLHSNEPPSIKDSPWIIQTYSNDEFRIPSRYYYVESIEYIDGTPIAKNHWWSYDGEKYHKHSGDKPFSIDEYGKVDITRR